MSGMRMQTVPMETLMEVISLQLRNGGKANLTVTGKSMAPMLHHRRDSVVLIPAEGIQKKGSVILYRRENGKYVLHRVISVTRNGYVCCGDNQWEKEFVKQTQQIAVVDSFQRNGKVYTQKEFSYRVYEFLWVELFFLRPVYIALRRGAGRFYRTVRLKSKRKANRR